MVIPATVLLAGLLSAHPLHVSLSNIEINSAQNKISVTHKFYIEDFNLLFFHLFEKNIEPKEDREFETNEKVLINNYMDNRFILLSGNDTIDLKYIRKEQNEESIWLYYTGNLTKTKQRSFVINNLLFLDLYEDQKNMVIVTQGQREKGIAFDYTDRRSALEIQDE